MTDAVPSFTRRLFATRLRDLLRGRIDGRLDYRWAIARAGLPAETAKLTEHVVRRTRLWKMERIDVAEELVAHFHDGLAAGHTAGQLVESFGDAQAAARLIRRAKKRNRPLLWHIWRWTFWAVLTLIGIYLLMIGRVLLGKPNVATNYLNRINRRAAAVEPSEAAWPEFRQALIELEFLNESMPQQIGRIVHASPGDPEWPALERYLLDHQPALAKLRRAAARSGLGYQVGFEQWSEDEMFDMRPPDPERRADQNPTLVSVLLSHVMALRSAGLLLAADARRAAQSGDADVAMDNLVAIFRLGRLVQESPFLVSGMVAIAIDRMGYDLIEELLTGQPMQWTDEQLGRLAHRVAANQLEWPRWLEGERMGFYDFVQRLYTDDGHGDGRITNEGLQTLQMLHDKPPLGNYRRSREVEGPLIAILADQFEQMGGPLLFVSAWMPSRSETTALFDRFMDHTNARIRTPLWQDFADDPAEEIENWPLSERIRFAPVAIMAPSHSAVHRMLETSRGQRDGVMLGLALELFHRKHGRWPTSLAELTPRYLPELPVDRITGEPLKYQIVGDRPQVYSVGVDHDDDGGRVPIKSEAASNWEFAGPTYWTKSPNTLPKHDGDWVLWSAVPEAN